LKYIVIATYILAIALQIYSVWFAFSLLKKVKSYAYSIFFIPLGLLVIIFDKLYYLVDCCLLGQYRIAEAITYLIISFFVLIGVMGLHRLFNLLEDQNEKLQLISKTDHLTKVLSRSEIESQIIQEIKRSDRSKHPIAFVMLDIDHFKKVNDTYGHAIGDVVLQSLAKYCSSQLRTIDAFGRVGGEEFLMMLPDTDESEAFFVAERIREGVASLVCAKVAGDEIKIQISLGVSVYEPGLDAPETPVQLVKKYFRRSDLAMYKAKQSGRNQTNCWHE
jgi:diguanylate cyclase (GGDEF)-like protein